MSPQHFGKFEVIRSLGKGAMGEVYLAKDPSIGREVAVKVILPGSTHEEFKIRFEREAKTAGALNHPNIVTIYDFGKDGADLFMAMEYVEGNDLDTLIKNSALSQKECLEALAQVCEGLGYAHSKGVIHRDVKPANVMVVKGENRFIAKVMDFGIAKIADSNLTITGMAIGTRSYMAPEYIISGVADARSDIFAVGVMLYECLSGCRPFTGLTEAAIYDSIRHDRPQPIDANLLTEISPSVLRILDRALEKKPDDRYQSANELAKDLRAAKDHGWAYGQTQTTSVEYLSPQDADKTILAPRKPPQVPVAPMDMDASPNIDETIVPSSAPPDAKPAPTADYPLPHPRPQDGKTKGAKENKAPLWIIASATVAALALGAYWATATRGGGGNSEEPSQADSNDVDGDLGEASSQSAGRSQAVVNNAATTDVNTPATPQKGSETIIAHPPPPQVKRLTSPRRLLPRQRKRQRLSSL